ncbi:C4-dicarboxylate transporter, DctM subunit [Malonomonas rubra DSM 5091]|uniref:C4-dicarboxylate transporter, DctM subunit n=1 Tax=Malonomonas rubra DSM 5091 TaxID=1122189 RepID=A0A1M6JZN3_MALRU|nr:TRAP transporter large permease [Malonomonas rubra]SHJ52117.1 C4-dicarboxylate transporter, DctM subunit [Malonomonas rubra DSM 5091]
MMTTIVGSFATLMLSGVPLAFMLIVVTMIALHFFSWTPLQAVVEQLFNSLDSFVLLAIPFFVLAGAIMTKGAIAKRLIAFINSLVGWFPGGLGISGVLACIFFAAISGSGPATVVAIGSIMVPALLQAGYHKRFAVGLITTSGSLGIVIPPSIPMILYCLVMNVSVAEMFMAGILPGLLIGSVLIFYTYMRARKYGWKIDKKPSWEEVVRTGKEGFWAILLPVIVLGGIYSGIFTPTEAAAISVVYALIVEIFIYRECTIWQIPGICKESSIMASCLLFLLAGAMTFNWLLTAEEIPAMVARFVMDHIDSPWMFLLAINLFLLVLGCFMDSVSAVLILSPLFLDTLVGYDIDLVHFGIIMILNIEFGMLTPPFGLNLFVSMGVTGEDMRTVVRGVLPFLLLLISCLFLVTYIPDLSLLLPKLFLR